MTIPRKVIPLALAGLTFVLAITASWRVSLWSDEVATASAARRSLPDLWRLLHTIDAVHGLYYGFMHVWCAVFGTSPLALRLPSALAAAATAAGVYLLVLRLADPKTALMAGLAFAVLPRVTWAGIEARPYSLTMLLAVSSTLVLQRLTVRATSRWWALYAALTAVGVVLNIYLALVVVAHGLTLVLAHRRLLARWIAWGLGGLAVAAAPLIGILGQRGQLGSQRWSLLELARNVLVNQWFLGETPTATGASGSLFVAGGEVSWWAVGALVASAAAWAAVIAGLFRAGASGREGRTADEAATAAAGPQAPSSLVGVWTWALPWLLVPTAAVVLAALVSPSLFNPRYLTFTGPAMAMLLGAVLSALRRRPAAAAALVIVLGVIPVYLSQRTVSAKSDADLSLVACYLDRNAQSGDEVYYGSRDAPNAAELVKRSLRTVALGYPGAVRGLRDLTLVESPARSATLFGTSTTLSRRTAALEDVRVLWVVRRTDRPTEAKADDATLRGLGFSKMSRWKGTQTEVLELVRR